MEVILEILFQFFGEIFLQLIFQGLGLVGEHAVRPYRKTGPTSPIGSVISHVLIGAACGALSLIVLRHSLATGELARLATLFGTPLVAGLLGAGLGVLLRKRGKNTVPLEQFGYAYLFAFSMSGVRFLATM